MNYSVWRLVGLAHEPGASTTAAHRQEEISEEEERVVITVQPASSGPSSQRLEQDNPLMAAGLSMGSGVPGAADLRAAALAALQQLTQRRVSNAHTSSSQGVQGSTATTPRTRSSSSAAAGGLTTAASPEETPAAAAERHRLTHPSLGAQEVLRWIDQLLPYAGLLLVVFLYHHCTQMFLYAWLLLAMMSTNARMRKAVRRELPAVEQAATAAAILCNTAAAAWLLDPQRLSRSLLLLRPKAPMAAPATLLAVLVNDSLVRFGSLLPKLLLISAQQALNPCCGGGCGGGPRHTGGKGANTQGRALTLLEYAVTLYRTLLPIPLWYVYFLHATPSTIFNGLVTGAYFGFKGMAVAGSAKRLAMAARLWLQRGAIYGTYVSEQDEEANAQCPICQDPPQVPVRLSCQHVFCEECIGEWLERDAGGTCPMCRAAVRPPGLQLYTDGATTLLPTAF